MKLETFGGQHISAVCKEAVALADKHGETVEFTFNDTVVKVQPGDTAEAAEQRWHTDFEAAAEAWRNSPEHKERERKRAEEYRKKCAASMTEPAFPGLALKRNSRSTSVLWWIGSTTTEPACTP